MQAVIFSEDALADTAPLWAGAMEHLSRRLGRVRPLDVADVPEERGAALAFLERWAGSEAGSWPIELARYYEDHIPVYVRPEPALNAAVRRLAADGLRLAAWSAGPPEASLVVTHFLGLGRSFETQVVDPSSEAPMRAMHELGVEAGQALVVSTSPAALLSAKRAGAHTAGALWTGAPRSMLLAVHPTLLTAVPGELVTLAASLE